MIFYWWFTTKTTCLQLCFSGYQRSTTRFVTIHNTVNQKARLLLLFFYCICLFSMRECVLVHRFYYTDYIDTVMRPCYAWLQTPHHRSVEQSIAILLTSFQATGLTRDGGGQGPIKGLFATLQHSYGLANLTNLLIVFFEVKSMKPLY